jgi:molybdopterin synthase sulfur carrier subunit
MYNDTIYRRRAYRSSTECKPPAEGREERRGVKVRVRAFAQLREALGADRMMDVPTGATVSTLLALLGAESVQAKEALFEGNGDLKGHVILMKNGRRVPGSEIGATPLAEGDEFALFPPVAGG